jgi:3-oxoadipate enol-lactonase
MPYAQLSRVRMHYYEYGDRATASELLVLVHGFQASGRIWQLMQEQFPAGYFSIAVNNRGAGETEAPPDEADFGCKPFADDVYELVTQLGIANFTLVGHSMGGATVMQFAVDHPDLLKALVLVDPAGPDGVMPPDGLDAQIDQRMASREQQRRAGTAGDGILTPRAGASEFQRLLAADMAAAPERRLRGSMRSMATLAIGERVGALKLPVLLAGGDADQLIPLNRMLETFGKLPKGSSLQIWHGIGHSPNVEIPGQTAAVIQQFIEQTVPERLAAVSR